MNQNSKCLWKSAFKMSSTSFIKPTACRIWFEPESVTYECVFMYSNVFVQSINLPFTLDPPYAYFNLTLKLLLGLWMTLKPCTKSCLTMNVNQMPLNVDIRISSFLISFHKTVKNLASSTAYLLFSLKYLTIFYLPMQDWWISAHLMFCHGK